ncbi:MAG TPA: aldo/keto reductase [Clostridia bacterium]|nr:aldo/keto reductase [Clostridia bacterium]
MQYRKFGKLDVKVSSLGFGTMRLPLNSNVDSDINEPEAIRMLRHAIDNGVNYIDTAYPYHQGKSENLVAKALKDGYREKVLLATKLPVWLVKEYSDFDKYLNEQLKKLETGQIDFYLLHSLSKKEWKKMIDLDVFKALENYKKSGKVKYIGFSFHDDFETFREIIDAYDWDFCQIQYNYMDEHEQAGTEGLRYAASKNIGVVVMEPIRGGHLSANPPDQVKEIWNSAPVKRSPAEWALRWVWNHPEVSVVLSGMSNIEQVEENIRVASAAEPESMTSEELTIVGKVRDTYRGLTKISCTGCRYCMPCPFGVSIPGNFNIYNDAFVYNILESKRKEYQGRESSKLAANCHDCGKCEEACPQHLPIRKLLKDVDAALAR